MHQCPSYEVASFWGIPGTSPFLCQAWHYKTCKNFPPTRFLLNNFQFNLALTVNAYFFFFFQNWFLLSHSFYLNFFSACPFLLYANIFFSSESVAQYVLSTKYLSIPAMLMQVDEDVGNTSAQRCTRPAVQPCGSINLALFNVTDNSFQIMFGSPSDF